MDQFGVGNWNMIPTMATHSNPTTPSNQDHLYLQQPQQFQQQHQQQFHQQQQFQLQQQQQQRYQISQPQQHQQQQQQQQPSQSLASHFHLKNNLADAIENGTRDQHFDTLVTELSTHFEKCQQLLNTISGSIATKAATVEGKKRKVEEAEQMLNQRRELIAKYKNSVEELTKSDLWEATPWKKLQVGDIVRVRQDTFFPADLLLLASTNPDGICYTETWDYVTPEKASEFKGEIHCEQSNNSLYTFTGNLLLQKQTIPIGPNQILLRGCSLRNTEYIVGTVMMNAMNVPSKRSTLERKLDKVIATLFGVLLCLCLIGAIGSFNLK
ncbi:hypothetical protein LXL04_030041 [Taraxacum kok-saghyz]